MRLGRDSSPTPFPVVPAGCLGTLQAAVNKLYRLLEIEIDGLFKTMLVRARRHHYPRGQAQWTGARAFSHAHVCVALLPLLCRAGSIRVFCRQLLKKKKYAALVAAEGPAGTVAWKKETKGLDLVRRDWCVISRELGGLVLDLILSGKDKEEVAWRAPGVGRQGVVLAVRARGGRSVDGTAPHARDRSLPRADLGAPADCPPLSPPGVRVRCMDAHAVLQVVDGIHALLTAFAVDARAGKVGLEKFVITKGLNKAPKDYPDAKGQPHLQVPERVGCPAGGWGPGSVGSACGPRPRLSLCCVGSGCVGRRVTAFVLSLVTRPLAPPPPCPHPGGYPHDHRWQDRERR